METSMQAHVKDVIGPLPDWGAMIIVEAEGKTFPVRCSMDEAESCHKIMSTGNADGPYAFVKYVMDATDVSVIGSEIVEREGSLLSSIRIKKGKRNMRLSSASPATAINFSLYTDCPLTISVDPGRIKDSTLTYNHVRCEIRKLWPMDQLNRTSELKAMAEYMEDAFPDGSSPITTSDGGRPRATGR